MENFFISLGLSYMFSKALAYLLMIALGAFLFVLIGKKSTSLNKIVRTGVRVLALLVPFAIYFALVPIYQGDFGDASRPTKLRNAKTTELTNGLLVLSVPGCPYCMESIASLKQMKTNNPKLNIRFYVCETTDSRNLKDFENEINGAFPIALLENSIAFVNEMAPSFPLFISVEDGTALKFWTNNEFGAHAKDYLVELSNK
jgi:hypothetical protein